MPLALVFVMLCSPLAQAAERARIPWDMETLAAVPAAHAAAGFDEPGVKAVFLEGPPWKGRRTRFFAWYAEPEPRLGPKAPGMVLVHGGGGTAYAEWVRMWVRRGYAAIAMDTCGSTPKPKDGPWRLDRARHEDGGPDGWGGFPQVDEPPEDQWPYHAVANVILAHSFLRSLPGVDPKRIGITGISWGGYLTTIAASVDPRFRFAVPVYGCGFLGEDSAWTGVFEKMGADRAKRWLELWDPSRYLPLARLPFLWINGTNDFAYPLSSWQKSYRLPRGPRWLSLQVEMKHSHPDGARPAEVFAFADAMTRGWQPLPRITRVERQGRTLRLRYRNELPIAGATLHCTTDTGPWQKRKWTDYEARWDGRARTVEADWPANAQACFVNLRDPRGLLVSSEHLEGE